MDRETHIQIDRIEQKLDYLINEFEEVYPKEETEEEDDNDSDFIKEQKRKGNIIEKTPKVRTTVKDGKSEFVEE